MDKERLFRFIDKKYASKREMYTALPLGMNADELWSEVLENRRSKGVILPIRNAAGQSYWYTLTDTMIRASENIVDELLDTEVTTPITSVSPIKEIFFTGYMEGAQISIRDAMSFLQSGEEPHDVEELMILNNRQAGTFAAENIHHPINEQYLRSLAGILTNGLDNGGGDFRTSDDAEILSMQGEEYSLPRAIDLSDRVGELTAMLADPGIHPIIKAAAAQAWVLVTRPFPEGNERLGRLLSEIILIRSGYTFFGEISISAIIAQNGYDYFNAIAKIIREENGADLTYFIEYYLSVLSSAVDDYRGTRRKQEEDNIEAERELARVPLSTTQSSNSSLSERMPADLQEILTTLQSISAAVPKTSKSIIAKKIQEFFLLGKYEFTTRELTDCISERLSQKAIYNSIYSLLTDGIIKISRKFGSKNYYTLNVDCLQDENLKLSSEDGSFKRIFEAIYPYTMSAFESSRRISEVLMDYLKCRKPSFTISDIKLQAGVSSNNVYNFMRKFIQNGLIESEDKIYRFCLNEPDQTITQVSTKMTFDDVYSLDVLQLVHDLCTSTLSTKKDKRIGEVISGCLEKGVVTADDYERIDEQSKMHIDMMFALQLGLVTPMQDGSYMINKTLTESLDAIEDSTKNALASLYKLFGDTSFSAEMVIAELDYSHSHVTATLHRMSWLKVLDCKRGKDNRMTYQFLVTPEDHPECFGTAA